VANAHGSFRVRSMYAEREEDCLIFKRETDGGMHLLETDLCGYVTVWHMSMCV
jgi:hypothetical protein